MSRTRVHRPHHAHILDAAVEVHDHRDHACDLVPVEQWARNLRSGTEPEPGCRWELPTSYVLTRSLCGCDLCTAQSYRRQERRRTSALGRQTARDEELEYRQLRSRSH